LESFFCVYQNHFARLEDREEKEEDGQAQRWLFLCTA